MRFSSFAAVLSSASCASALSTIKVVGSKFFDEDGKQFFMKGVAYQLTEDDPLTDPEQCARDASMMKTLGTNVIRVYHVDSKGDHDGCMKEFDNAGIYTLIDLDTFDTYILPNNPWWNQTQHDAYAAVIDAFAGYNNTLGFFIGNEIIAQNNQSQVAPFIKAATRDMKSYRNSKNYREIPIGYSAADIAELRPALQDYLTCGGNASENIDFFALNSYEWCDPATYETSGYENLEAMAVNFPVPMFFSETGCNTGQARLFDDQAAIFGPDMVNDWSGSLVYEWIEEANNYGLISYGPKVAPDATVGSDVVGGYTRKGTPSAVTPDFDNLKKAWATVTPTGVASSAYDPNKVSTRACPTSSQGGWLVEGNVALPTLGATYSGTYTTAPSAMATPSGTGTAASPSSTQNPAPPTKEIAGMSAGLVAVMLFFTYWM